MNYIRRLNLSFDLRRDHDNQVYQILNSKQYKTGYIIEAVLEYENMRKNYIDKDVIKEALKEVLLEIEVGIESKQSEAAGDIPKAVFDIFEQM